MCFTINTIMSASVVAFMKPALIALGLILGVLAVACIAFTVFAIRSRAVSTGIKIVLIAIYGVMLLVLVFSVICFRHYQQIGSQPATEATTTAPTTEATTFPETEPPTEPPTEPEPTVNPAFVESSNPDNWNVKWQILQGSDKVDTFLRDGTISFGQGDSYSAVEGIISFRGDNYRSGATYGTTDVVSKTLAEKWNARVGALKGDYGNWCGCGWTGQPLIVRWDEETKAILGLYEKKKAKQDLVEVIYATLDGKIYFYDLEDGSYTRDPISMGMNFKGAGSLDPRGYPLMYVGSGDYMNGKKPRMYVISLITNEILYEQSGKDSSTTRSWCAFDSAPLVDAKTDTLIWPCENGALYTIKLNTAYDTTAGTISVTPENVAKTAYTTGLKRKIGYEASAIVVDGYLYAGDNGGMFFCVDLNTMELKWAQNTMDDVNATPVFEWGDDGNGYIYTGSSMEYAKGTTYIHKLNASTGEIIWERKFTDVAYNKTVSGGILSSPLLGKKGTELEGLIIYPIARTPSTGSGTIVALDTETGETVWEVVNKNYHWSSPVGVYSSDNKAYILLGDSAGKMTMYDAAGKIVTSIALGSNIEASPVVFENTLVVGTRGRGVFGISIG